MTSPSSQSPEGRGSQPPGQENAARAATSHAAISGATGLLGSALAAQLRAESWTVHQITRRPGRTADDIAWDPDAGRIDRAALEGMDLVVHLAGEPIAQRWTAERKHRIRESRTKGTTLLASTLASLSRPPAVFLSASAIGYYGNRAEEELDESSSAGTDFLAGVAQQWESATAPASAVGIRVVLLRTGIVLTAQGGALGKMLLPFKLGLGGKLGSGKQWMSWIALEDWIRAVRFLVNATAESGPVNLVAPNPVRNAEFAQTLARVLGRPSFAPVPTFALELLFGEMADATLLASQRVRARRLLEAGFEFRQATLERALREGLGGRG